MSKIKNASEVSILRKMISERSDQLKFCYRGNIHTTSVTANVKLAHVTPLCERAVSSTITGSEITLLFLVIIIV